MSTLFTLDGQFEKYKAFATRCAMWEDRVVRAWELVPHYANRTGDALPSFLGDSNAAIKDLVLALESSALAASRLQLAAEILIKHISMEA